MADSKPTERRLLDSIRKVKAAPSSGAAASRRGGTSKGIKTATNGASTNDPATGPTLSNKAAAGTGSKKAAASQPAATAGGRDAVPTPASTPLPNSFQSAPRVWPD